MIPSHLPEHSPLGGSSMARVMKCPGSVTLAIGCVDEDSEYASLGSVAHHVAEVSMRESKMPMVFQGKILNQHGREWPRTTEEFHPGPAPDGYHLVDKEMADAVYVWKEAIDEWHPMRSGEGSNRQDSYIEHPFYCPTIHKYFWGKSDFVYVDFENRTLHVWDYKHGAGVMVMPENNVQGMYYACGVLESLDLWDDIDTIVIHIVQPRGYLEPHRHWTVDTDTLLDWMLNDLIPAMDLGLTSNETASGDHCIFCPVRNYACPRLVSDMEEFEQMVQDLEEGKRKVEDYSNEELGRFMHLRELAKGTVGKAAEKVAFHRLQAGAKVPGFKLAGARSNREWKDGAEAAAKKQFKTKAYAPRALRSPAQMESLPGGEAFAERWAFKPDKGLTVVKEGDVRRAVDRSTKSAFKPVKGKKK